MGADIIQLLKKQAEGFGAVVSNETIEKVDFSTWPFKLWTDDGREILAFSVIIATGASPRLLGIEGELNIGAKELLTVLFAMLPIIKILML